MRATVICDLDGCIVKHNISPLELLPDSWDTLYTWRDAGHFIVIITARPWTDRPWLIDELARLEVPYDEFITDAGDGIRYLINDKKPINPDTRTAIAFNVERNKGIDNLKELI